MINFMLWVFHHQKGVKSENVHWEKCFHPMSIPTTRFPALPWLLGVNTIEFYCLLFPYIFMTYKHTHIYIYILIDISPLAIKSTTFYILILTLSSSVKHIEMFFLFYSCRPTTVKALIALKTHRISFNLWKRIITLLAEMLAKAMVVKCKWIKSTPETFGRDVS